MSAMAEPLITLTTDFGEAGPYVAAMKGVILSLQPRARLVDLSHVIPPQDLRHAAHFLEGCLPHFPAETIHVVVVDPGVGTDRAALCVEAAGQFLLVPDNGCWCPAVARLTSQPTVRRLAESRFWRPEVSTTFHGRDIFAPCAAYLTLGVLPSALGPEVKEWVHLQVPAATIERGSIQGEIVFVDPFGNLVTNIPGEAFLALAANPVQIQAGPVEVRRVVRTYGEANEGELIALVGSDGYLEVAINRGNAARRLELGVGDPVLVRELA